MNIPLTLGDYNGRSNAANAMELVNMMSEGDNTGGNSPFFLTNTPGCVEFVDIDGAVGEGRGGFMFPGYCLVVVGRQVYRVATSGAYLKVGNLKTTSGAVQFAENPDQILITDGQRGYVYKKAENAIFPIVDPDFPTPKACTFKDGYGVVVESSTGRFYVSAINDFLSWSALDFTTAEFQPDNLVGCISAIDSLFAFGEKTTQVYYNSGNAAFPFDNRSGANLSVGCGATNSPAEGDNLAFFVDDNFQVRMLDGYIPRTISTPQIDYRLARLTNPQNIRGFFYVQDGHPFYALIHPELCLTYDVTTAQWHRRTSGIFGRYRPAWIAQYGTAVLAGDYTNGRIYWVTPDAYQDNATETAWKFTMQAVDEERNLIQHNLLEIVIDAGEGPGDPQLWMQYSDDNGKTWSREKWRSMGKTGEFYRRIRWNALGTSRNRIYRIGGSDAVKRNIIKARLEGKIVAQ